MAHGSLCFFLQTVHNCKPSGANGSLTAPQSFVLILTAVLESVNKLSLVLLLYAIITQQCHLVTFSLSFAQWGSEV